MFWLGAITYWRFDELGAAPKATAIAALWALGVVALALLARGWRSR
jgi:hypothetical protein